MAIKWHLILPQTRWADRLHAIFRFRKRLGRWPDPKRMLWNDEVFRLKVSEEILDPARQFVSDKEYVKLFISAVVGQQYNVPTLQIIRSVDDLAGLQVNQPVCIKPTHMSGQVIFADPDNPPDVGQMSRWFSQNYYLTSREANYRYLKPKVIVEPLLFGSREVEDFKFYSFDGEPKIVTVDHGRFSHHRRSVMNMDWEKLPFSIRVPQPQTPPPPPARFAEMKALATKLAGCFTGQVRIDFFAKDDVLYVGEITNITSSAATLFLEPEGEEEASRLLLG